MKHFLPNASEYLVGRPCQVCDIEIEPKDAVYFEIDVAGDGDNERAHITVAHGWCTDFVRDAVRHALDTQRIALWFEASNIVAHNDPASALEALQFRHARAVRQAQGESGARVVEAVLGKVS